MINSKTDRAKSEITLVHHPSKFPSRCECSLVCFILYTLFKYSLIKLIIILWERARIIFIEERPQCNLKKIVITFLLNKICCIRTSEMEDAWSWIGKITSGWQYIHNKTSLIITDRIYFNNCTLYLDLGNAYGWKFEV